MDTYPVLKPKEVVAILEKLGFKEIRQRGSHKQFQIADAPQFPFTPEGYFTNPFSDKLQKPEG